MFRNTLSETGETKPKDDIPETVFKNIKKICEHEYIKIETTEFYNEGKIIEDLFYCKKCLDYQKRIRP